MKERDRVLYTGDDPECHGDRGTLLWLSPNGDTAKVAWDHGQTTWIRANLLGAVAAPNPPQSDARFSMGLLHDVFTLLQTHGYQASGPNAHIDAAVHLMRLTIAFEGKEVVTRE